MFHFFDAHAIISYFPGGYQINCFSFQILQTAHDGSGEVFKVVSGGTLRFNSFYRFGRDKISSLHSRRNRASGRSLRPSPYASAVSKKLIP